MHSVHWPVLMTRIDLLRVKPLSIPRVLTFSCKHRWIFMVSPITVFLWAFPQWRLIPALNFLNTLLLKLFTILMRRTTWIDGVRWIECAALALRGPWLWQLLRVKLALKNHWRLCATHGQIRLMLRTSTTTPATSRPLSPMNTQPQQTTMVACIAM